VIKMARQMEITIKIKDENGIYIEETRETSLPHIAEIDAQGFKKSLNDLETAVIETRKEITDEVVKQYMEEISKKKQKKK